VCGVGQWELCVKVKISSYIVDKYRLCRLDVLEVRNLTLKRLDVKTSSPAGALIKFMLSLLKSVLLLRVTSLLEWYTRTPDMDFNQ